MVKQNRKSSTRKKEEICWNEGYFTEVIGQILPTVSTLSTALISYCWGWSKHNIFFPAQTQSMRILFNSYSKVREEVSWSWRSFIYPYRLLNFWWCKRLHNKAWLTRSRIHDDTSKQKSTCSRHIYQSGLFKSRMVKWCKGFAFNVCVCAKSVWVCVFLFHLSKRERDGNSSILCHVITISE